MNLIAADTKYIVVGLGMTGVSCVRHLVSAGKQVEVVDSRENPPGLAEFIDQFENIKVTTGAFNADYLRQADYLVMSPGVALSTPAIKQAVDGGAKVTSDIELFLNEFKGRVVAITGSNAKSTVTSWLGDAISRSGTPVLVAGNIGKPVLEGLGNAYDIAVLELSSFQLELISRLNADVATILNVSEDHMDRYASFAEYQQAKQRIYFGCASAIYNRNDALTQPLVPESTSVISFALNQPDLNDYGLLETEEGTYLARGFDKVLLQSEVSLPGQHNIENALAVLALADAVAVPRKATIEALKQYTGLPHRCQFVAELNQVKYFNDSKATNVGSTLAAVKGLANGNDNNIVLLLGGQSKGQDLSPLKQTIEAKCKSVFVYGEDAKKFKALLPASVEFDSMAQALAATKEVTDAGDIVLLSPACASFDQFLNFEARGDAFVRWVEAQR